MSDNSADLTESIAALKLNPALLELAEHYIQKFGVSVLPVSGKEVASPRHWTHFVDKPIDAQPWVSATGIAFVCGKNGYRCIDVDECPPDKMDAVAEAILGALHLPATYPWRVITATGFHLWFRTPDAPMPSPQDVGTWYPWGVFENTFFRIELRYANAYALVPPSLHPTGQPYTFREGTAPDQPPAEVDFTALTNAICKVAYFDDGICGGCYQPYEGCTCWEREERESEYGWD